jgi:hypothetical protein
MLPSEWRNGLPGLVVARAILTMQRMENADVRFSRGIEDLQHMRNAMIGFGDALQAIPYLASLGNEIVVRIDHQESSDVLVIRHVGDVRSHSGGQDR